MITRPAVTSEAEARRAGSTSDVFAKSVLNSPVKEVLWPSSDCWSYFAIVLLFFCYSYHLSLCWLNLFVLTPFLLRNIEDSHRITIPHISKPCNFPLDPLLSRLSKLSSSKPCSLSHAFIPLLIFRTVLWTPSSMTKFATAVPKPEGSIPAEAITVQRIIIVLY